MAVPLAARPSLAALSRGYAEASLMVAASTLVGLAAAPRWGNDAIDLLYLPAVLGAALLAGLGPALFAALASALAYNFFFTAPRFTFRIDSPNDIVTVLVLFAVATVVSQLAASARRQARIARAHAERNATIAGLAGRLLSCTSSDEVAEVAAAELARLFGCNAVLVGGATDPRVVAGAPPPVRLEPGDLAVAALVLDRNEPAGRGVDRAIPTEWQFHPVRSASGAIAALGLARDDGLAPVRRDQLPLLGSLLGQVALALERARLESDARDFARVRERDQVRSVLLATIAQDVGPPLKAITGAVAALRRSGSGDRNLVSAVAAETGKLERYVSNLLELGPEGEQKPLALGAVTIDLLRREVLRDGKEVHLTPKEFAVLAELAKHPGQVLGHGHLLRTVWGPAQEKQIEYLRVAIRALRQKLERDPAHPVLIVNAPAVGYRLRSGGLPDGASPDGGGGRAAAAAD